MFYLGRLVAGAHNLLYRDRSMSLRGAVRALFTDVPREVRRSAAPIALAALLLLGPALIAAVSVARTPGLASKLLPAGMLQRADDGVRRARAGEGYIDDPQLLRPVMASSIVTNNVQVTFAVFAGGVTAGSLSVLMLVLNGISLGSVVGALCEQGDCATAAGLRGTARSTRVVRDLRGGGRRVPTRGGHAHAGTTYAWSGVGGECATGDSTHCGVHVSAGDCRSARRICVADRVVAARGQAGGERGDSRVSRRVPVGRPAASRGVCRVGWSGIERAGV